MPEVVEGDWKFVFPDSWSASKFDDQKLRQRIRAIDPHVNVWGVSEQGIPWSVEKAT